MTIIEVQCLWTIVISNFFIKNLCKTNNMDAKLTTIPNAADINPSKPVENRRLACNS
jgi:hypothetical protein